MGKEKKKIILRTNRKLNSKYLIDINAKSESIEVVEDNIGEYPQDFGLGNNFLSRAQEH